MYSLDSASVALSRQLCVAVDEQDLEACDDDEPPAVVRSRPC